MQTVTLHGKKHLEDFLKQKLLIPVGTADRLLREIDRHNLVFEASTELSDEIRLAVGLVSPDEDLPQGQTAC